MGTDRGSRCDQHSGHDIERAAVAAEGLDPDDPALVAALARVRTVLPALRKRHTRVSVPSAIALRHRLNRCYVLNPPHTTWPL